MPVSPSSTRAYDAILLGAGAAGLFCAARAAEQGRRVLVLDHAPRAGRKILISGGGRANFTNLDTRPEHFLSENPHFAKSALARYTPQDFVALVEQYGIGYHAKAPGQLFCDGSASQIVNMLLDLCARAGGAERRSSGSHDRTGSGDTGERDRLSHAPGSVKLHLSTAIRSVEYAGGHYQVTTSAAGSGTDAAVEVFTARSLVIATGGLSIPKLGATALGYDLARQFDLRIVEPRPALVPLLFQGADRARFDGLSGVATEVTATLQDGETSTAFRDKLLITHRGFSGPAILQISSYWRPGRVITLDLAPGQQATAPLLTPGARRDPASLASAWQASMPRRLADRLLAIAPPANWRTAGLEAAEQTLHAWPLLPAGTEGYEKAEVTAGGIATDELSARTMEARRQPGLFCIGEVVDVTGHLGGYNFQWAWASAAAAAEAL